MNRPRQPGTIEAAIAYAIGILGCHGVAEAIGKSESMVRNYADPDDDTHNIQSRHATAIDIACMKAGAGTPMASAQRRMVEAATRDLLPDEDPARAVFGIIHDVAILGRIAGGGDLDGTETADVIDRIRRGLDAVEPVNTLTPSAVVKA